MKLPKIPLAQTVIKLCELKEVEHIVISPGSRNAPLTIGFTNHPYFKCYSVVDERCAAFFALGMAQQLGKPVALVCTSGSALLNYYPAIAEAYYSNIPLVVLSADRPAHLIGVGDGQTINQKGVYSNHILYEANLDEVDSKNNNVAEINTAINLSLTQQGPVHINIPFNEPLYDMVDAFSVTPKSIEASTEVFDVAAIETCKTIWESSAKKMVLVGVNKPNSVEQKYLEALANDESVLVFTESTSNLHHDNFFPSIDKIIAPLNDQEFEALQPEILLTFGGLIVSKKIKAFLRKYQPKHHWHIDENRANDTFFCLEKHFKCTPNVFFENFFSDQSSSSNYRFDWSKVKAYRTLKHNEYVANIPYSDFTAFNDLLKSIPDNSIVHSSNSSAIRYIQLFDINKTLKIYCNRGTSGIDGSSSTAVGASAVSNNPVVLITGDLSFFYDSNAFWNKYIPSSFRIILVNNSGGGIFRILPGHKNTQNFEDYFETTHNLNASHLCDMYNIKYCSANSKETLTNALQSFYSNSNKPKLLEVFTPRTTNDDVLLSYFKGIK
ncbi:2-succinyl-5-enolpyruvyl-6-hydroxy-3-cyclohexene-1-carboxylic-acid synthase [Pontimicrobium sp. IMCC45349]|uniref:2-succinyl-5-enolpyruvyl-6-hydroxy-3- cyclohexene-1-carboxylic-acid synthase n=1 Tax=Pontimicrobium sp. IMCC45349 TaxID=3391574 RepID=UPI0039A0F346